MADKTFETRAAAFELREASDGPTLEGYAAMFDQDYDLGPFRERIDSGAFKRTLGTGPDVRLLINHDGEPLARTKSGTLDLSTDSTGLHVRARLEPSDPDVQRLLPKMRRGDLDQMSFAFRVPKGGDSWSDDFTQRTLHNIELQGGDVSVVTFPANPATSASVRARDVRDAYLTLASAMFAEVREGKTFSADNATKLKRILDLIAAADDAVDEAQPLLADVLGVPNPDKMDDRAASKTPYGDVDYADPGYQSDGKKRYPIDTAEHTKAAWAYINKKANQNVYTQEQVDEIMSRIKAAAKKFGIQIGESNSLSLSLAQAIAARCRITAA